MGLYETNLKPRLVHEEKETLIARIMLLAFLVLFLMDFNSNLTHICFIQSAEFGPRLVGLELDYSAHLVVKGG